MQLHNKLHPMNVFFFFAIKKNRDYEIEGNFSEMMLCILLEIEVFSKGTNPSLKHLLLIFKKWNEDCFPRKKNEIHHVDGAKY